MKTILASRIGNISRNIKSVNKIWDRYDAYLNIQLPTPQDSKHVMFYLKKGITCTDFYGNKYENVYATTDPSAKCFVSEIDNFFTYEAEFEPPYISNSGSLQTERKPYCIIKNFWEGDFTGDSEITDDSVIKKYSQFYIFHPTGTEVTVTRKEGILQDDGRAVSFDKTMEATYMKLSGRFPETNGHHKINAHVKTDSGLNMGELPDKVFLLYETKYYTFDDPDVEVVNYVSGGGSLSGGAIAGIVIACIVVVAVVVFCIVWFVVLKKGLCCGSKSDTPTA